ncbi:hypothetical protein [Streptacidiphilus sp. EB103A]|uniref:hypothetical protein n=1 Tax=Streptacidiphilus sp. EB103A TaxID=3156275 RepID=UPI003511E47A
MTLLEPQAQMRADDLHARHLRVHPGRTVDYTATDEPGTDPATVWCTCRIPAPVKRELAAVHEAGHAVIGVALGLTLANLSIAGRIDLDGGWSEGGGAGFEPKGEVQSFGAALMAGHLAEIQQAHHRGYTSPELDECRTHYGAALDWAGIEHIRDHGLLIDTEHAAADVQRLLADPSIAAAIRAVAMLLESAGQGTHDQVVQVLAEQGVTTAQIWQPTHAELFAYHRDWAASQETGTGDDRRKV